MSGDRAQSGEGSVAGGAQAVQLLANPIRDCHAWLEATMGDVTPEQAHWRPPGTANPIAAVYAHVVVGADVAVNTILRGRQALIVGEWQGRAGLSGLMPLGAWHEWAVHLSMDLGAFRPYARAVYAGWDEYLASLPAEQLDRVVDLSRTGMGQRTMGQYLAMQVEHFSCHCGEIACLKGLQGATGYRPGTADGIG